MDPTTERGAPEEGESAGSGSASEAPGPVTVGDVVVATDGSAHKRAVPSWFRKRFYSDPAR